MERYCYFMRLNKLHIIFLFMFVIIYRAFSLFPPAITLDAAAYCMQAYHITKGIFPLFYYGQKFMGTGGAFLMAGFIKLFGVSAFTFNLFGLFTSLIFIALIVVYSFKLFDKYVALLVTIFMIIPTRELLVWSREARPDYTLTFIAVPVILLLTYSIIVSFRVKKRITLKLSILGIISGFALWNNFLIAPALVTSFIFLSIYLKKEFILNKSIVYFSFFCIGSLPLIYANITMNFYVLKIGTFDSLVNLPAKMQAFFRYALPFFWGFENTYHSSLEIKEILLYIWVIITYILFIYKCMFPENDREKLTFRLTGFYFFFHLFISTFSVYGKRYFHFDSPITYIMPLYSVAFIIPIATILSLKISRLSRIFFLLPMFLFMLNNYHMTKGQLNNCFKYLGNDDQLVHNYPDTKAPLVIFSKDKETYSGYLRGMQSNMLRIRYLDLLIISNPYEENFVPYAIEVDSSKRIFWVEHGDLNISSMFDMIGLEYKSEDLHGKIYYDFKSFQLVSGNIITNFTVKCSSNNFYSQFLNDGIIDTSWLISGNQQKGDEIIISLQSSKRLQKMVLIPQIFYNSPHSFSVELSDDAENWKEVNRIDSHVGSMFYSVFHPFMKVVKPRVEISLGDKEAKYIKIHINKDYNRSLVLDEIYLFESRKEKINEDKYFKEIDFLIKQIQYQYPKDITIVADHWFENYFKKYGFNVEFISNKFISNYKDENPAFLGKVPLDFINNKFIFIVENSFVEQIRNLLEDNKVHFDIQKYSFYSIISTSSQKSKKQLYWNGFTLNYFLDKQMKNLNLPHLKDIYKDVSIKDIVFSNTFKICEYKLEKDSKDNVSVLLEIEYLKRDMAQYYCFIHFCDKNNNIIAQGDFLMRNYQDLATPLWTLNQKVILDRKVVIPEQKFKQIREIRVGIWDPIKKKNLLINNKETFFKIDSHILVSDEKNKKIL